MVNGARLVGPALAGIVLAKTSPGVCFLINAVSYVAVLMALLAMRVIPRQLDRPRARLVHGLREGFAYAFGFAPIRSLLTLLAVVSLLGMSYSVLLPVFATDVLKGGADTLGFLSAAAGIGALTAAVLLAGRKSVLGLGRWIAFSPCLLGLALVGFSFSRDLRLSLAVLFVAGFAMMMQMASTNTVLQTIVDEDKRGRVMSFYTMAFMGMAPLGSLLAGFLAERLGATLTVSIAGVCCIAAAAVFMTRLRSLRALVRPIYQRIGILPELATGIQAATELSVPPERE
jgi:MFS family permease